MAIKIRMDFVTNSSSTSFCVVGMKIDKNEPDWEKLEKLGLRNEYTDMNYNSHIVGMSILKMQNDETMNEFETRIAKAILKLGVSNILDLMKQKAQNEEPSIKGMDIHYGGYRDG